MIALEKREGKYDVAKHKERLNVIVENWDEILEIISTLPSYDELFSLYKKLGIPTEFSEAGLDEGILPEALSATRDIRDKYVLTRLIYDLGLLELYGG